MFTGIVSELGTIDAIEPSDTGVRFTITAPRTVIGVQTGDSIAVNGVCLTVTGLTPGSFRCVAVTETLERSSLGALKVHDPVNLERPMPADGRFDGHMVQGHVDGVGTILSIDAEGDAKRIRVGSDSSLARYMVEKGSVTLDGTSLTITAVAPIDASKTWIEVVLIPHTLENTVFGTKNEGDTLNIEVDVIAKYVERMTGLDR
jgi:riboflavin synthase